MKARIVEKDRIPEFQSIDELSTETKEVIRDVSYGRNVVGPYKTVDECFLMNKTEVGNRGKGRS